MTPTKSERVLILKQIIHQSILEHCADLLDEENIIFHQLQLEISDPEKREDSELHIRMADVAWNEYEKTMFNKSDQTQLEKLEAEKKELLALMVTMKDSFDNKAWVTSMELQSFSKQIESLIQKHK